MGLGSAVLGSWLLASALAAQGVLAPPALERSLADPVTATVPEDPEVAKVIEPYAAQVHKRFGQVLARAPKGLPKGGAPGTNPLGFFVADLMRDAASKVMGAEVRFAVTNNGGLRRNLSPGDVRVGDIYEIMPFENELVVAEYTGAQIMAIVREGIQRKGGEPCSGVKASVGGTADKPVITITWSDGSPIDPQGRFLAATTDYLLVNGDATPTLKAGAHPVPTGVPLRQMIIDACRRLGEEGKPVLAPADPRYVFTPELLQALRATAL